jgi:preprotein translocase subunit SecE
MPTMNLTQLFQKKQAEGDKSSSRSADASKKAAAKTLKTKKTEPAKKPAKKSEESRMAWWYRFQEYLREVVYELRRVVWPSKKETIGSTSVVLVIVLLCGVFLGVVDVILSRLIRVFIG